MRRKNVLKIQDVIGGMFGNYNAISVQAKSGFWFAVCSILQKGISFITVPIFTRLLSTEEYGTYSLYLSWLQIITILTSLYLFNGVMNNAMVKFESQRNEYISSMQGLTITITSIIITVYLLLKNEITRIVGLAPIYMYLMFSESVTTTAFNYWSSKKRFEYNYKILVVVTLAKSFINPLLGLLAVYALQDKSYARVLSVVITEIIFCIPIMIIQFQKGKTFFDKNYWLYSLRLGLPLIPHYLSTIILNQGDRIMIEKMVGRAEVALYSISYNIGFLVQIFTNAIINSFTPWFYQKVKSEDYSGVCSTINKLLLLSWIIAIVLMLCSPELVCIFGSTEYANAVYVIPPVSASVFFIFLYQMLSLPEFYFENTKFMLVASVLAAAVNIALNYVFIKIFGYVAAGYTTLICYILYSMGHFYISSRVLSKFMPEHKRDIFDTKSILILALAIIVITIFINFLFPHRLLRYLVIIILGIVVVKKYKNFVHFANEQNSEV